jgi:MFS family permease
VAGVLTVQSIPWLVLAVPTGVLADRWDRGRVMVLANLGQAVALAAVVGLVAAHRMTIPWLYVLAFLLGSLETVYLGAAQAVVPQLVPEVELERANGYLAATETTGGQLIGPALGGLAFTAGRVIPFAADGASFLASAGILVSLRGKRAPRTDERVPLRRDLVGGLGFFRKSSLLRWLAAFTAGLVLTQAVVMGPLVLYVLRDLRLSSTGYGLLLAVAAIGNVVGSLTVSRLRTRFSAATLLIGSGLAAAFGYLAIAGAVLVPVAVVGLMVEALAVACGTVASVSLRQRHIPPELLGRVSNLFRSLIWGAVPVGALVGGALASSLGLRAPFVVAGAAQVVMVVTFARPLHRVTKRVEVPPDGIVDLTRADSEPPVGNVSSSGSATTGGVSEPGERDRSPLEGAMTVWLRRPQGTSVQPGGTRFH